LRGEASPRRKAREPLSENLAREARRLHGEIFVCLDEAVRQAQRFHTSWPAELMRYVIHGLLHLRGFNDARPAARRRMKREEDRLLRRVAGRFDLSRLAKPPESGRRGSDKLRRHRPRGLRVQN
jgi:rRNA maturation RNase YbeY